MKRFYEKVFEYDYLTIKPHFQKIESFIVSYPSTEFLNFIKTYCKSLKKLNIIGFDINIDIFDLNIN